MNDFAYSRYLVFIFQIFLNETNIKNEMIKPLNSWFNRFLMKEKSKVKKIY